MKSFQTLGDGPDRAWRTDEERVRGEAQLLADFAEALERAMRGRRSSVSGILPMFTGHTAQLELLRAWSRLNWEREPGPPNPKQLNTIFKRLQGPQHRFNRRWDPELRRMLWGFDSKRQK